MAMPFAPSGMGRLERLNHFDGCVVGGEQGCGLEDLNSLEQLRVLEIRNLNEAAAAQGGRHVLVNKRHLEDLRLICHIRRLGRPARYSDEGEIRRIQDVFEELAPPPCLETLQIYGYLGRQFPSWMMSSWLGSLLPHLTSLFLNHCINVVQLPPLGLLPDLRRLAIYDAEAVVSFGSEVYGGGSTRALFPKLEYLHLLGMPKLQEWSFCREEEITVFPNLRKLTVRDCWRLKSLPGVLKGSPLKELSISGSILRAIDNLPHLSEVLHIEDCGSLERISHLPALRELRIGSGCFPLKHVEKLDSLERLALDRWWRDFLPEGLLRLLKERQLHQDNNFTLYLYCADGNDDLFSKCVMGGEYWPIIENIPRVEARVNCMYGKDMYLRYTKEPYQYETNYTDSRTLAESLSV